MTKKETSDPIQEAIRKSGAELIQSINEEIFLCEISSNLDRFRRFIRLFHYHINFELLKSLKDKGLTKELTELADKAGKLK